jgi:hypothetical protein
MKARIRLISTVTLDKKSMIALARKHTLFLRWRRLTKKGIIISTLMIMILLMTLLMILPMILPMILITLLLIIILITLLLITLLLITLMITYT